MLPSIPRTNNSLMYVHWSGTVSFLPHDAYAVHMYGAAYAMARSVRLWVCLSSNYHTPVLCDGRTYLACETIRTFLTFFYVFFKSKIMNFNFFWSC